MIDKIIRYYSRIKFFLRGVSLHYLPADERHVMIQPIHKAGRVFDFI